MSAAEADMKAKAHTPVSFGELPVLEFFGNFYINCQCTFILPPASPIGPGAPSAMYSMKDTGLEGTLACGECSFYRLPPSSPPK